MLTGIKNWQHFKMIWDETNLAASRLGLLHFLNQTRELGDGEWKGPTLSQLVPFCLDAAEQCLLDIETAQEKCDWVTKRTLIDMFKKCLLFVIDEYTETEFWKDCGEEQSRFVKLLADEKLYTQEMGISGKEPYCRKITEFLDKCCVGTKRTINLTEPIPEKWYWAVIYSGSDRLLHDRANHFNEEDPMFGILKKYLEQKIASEKKSLINLMYYASENKKKIVSIITLFLFLAKKYGKLEEINEML